MISLMEQALFIHPVPSHLAQDYGSSSGGQAHLIYKRSLNDVIGQGCDVSGEISVVRQPRFQALLRFPLLSSKREALDKTGHVAPKI